MTFLMSAEINPETQRLCRVLATAQAVVVVVGVGVGVGVAADRGRVLVRPRLTVLARTD